ncbi:MAG: hypothetical protein QOK23_296 [Gammaproteobacteria bacterium]|nr:hypothetical protein [Gammaproteobacteria bacterium]
MRSDIAINDVLLKCEALKRAGLWAAEPRIRPRAWISNFDQSDRAIAAKLLDRFTFYNSALTDRLLVASFDSIGDGMPKGPNAPTRAQLLSVVGSAVWTPVQGESPNPTDSGNLLCRRARQLLAVPEDRIVEADRAIAIAAQGHPIVFVDDFVGSGEQFLKTWTRSFNGDSFAMIHSNNHFTAIYITLVATAKGIGRIYNDAPSVAVCATHILEDRSTIYGCSGADLQFAADMPAFLQKYSSRLRPQENYISSSASFLQYGFGSLGLMFGFDHSIPDATLPIFWAPGDGSWEPLIERN